MSYSLNSLEEAYNGNIYIYRGVLGVTKGILGVYTIVHILCGDELGLRIFARCGIRVHGAGLQTRSVFAGHSDTLSP